jgi:hypothetical protein
VRPLLQPWVLTDVNNSPLDADMTGRLSDTWTTALVDRRMCGSCDAASMQRAVQPAQQQASVLYEYLAAHGRYIMYEKLRPSRKLSQHSETLRENCISVSPLCI